jgi:hypothetical protein
MEGVSGSVTAWSWRSTRGEGPRCFRSGSPWRAGRRECDRGRQRHVRPARATPTKLTRVTARATRVAARLTRGRTLSQPGDATLNRVPAWGWGFRQRSSGVGAKLVVFRRVQAHAGTGRPAKCRSERRKREARESGGSWVLVTTVRLHRSRKDISHHRPRAFGRTGIPAVLATRCDPVPDTAGPPRVVKRVSGPAADG